LYESVVLESTCFINFYNYKTPQKIGGIALEYVYFPQLYTLLIIL